MKKRSAKKAKWVKWNSKMLKEYIEQLMTVGVPQLYGCKFVFKPLTKKKRGWE